MFGMQIPCKKCRLRIFFTVSEIKFTYWTCVRQKENLVATRVSLLLLQLYGKAVALAELCLKNDGGPPSTVAHAHKFTIWSALNIPNRLKTHTAYESLPDTDDINAFLPYFYTREYKFMLFLSVVVTISSFVALFWHT